MHTTFCRSCIWCTVLAEMETVFFSYSPDILKICEEDGSKCCFCDLNEIYLHEISKSVYEIVAANFLSAFLSFCPQLLPSRSVRSEPDPP